ncbi:MAG: flagellar basal body protein [Candidatus Margulisbacteria bacterium]|nr:flagellar basal body protein [Candidatus Margulisiibacteriota bacterium]
MAGHLEVFDATFGTLEQAMRVATMQQQVIAHNIANAKTPGYEALTFDEELNKAVKRQDKKNVTLEEEMAALAENSGKYSAYVKLMTSKINVLRTVATQGRR